MYLSKEQNGLFVPEWARQYLETVGPELTPEKMLTIATGQYSLQKKCAGPSWVSADFSRYGLAFHHRLL
jgi:hypothetical protein